jgi:K+-transporting ATPase ATPase B chain
VLARIGKVVVRRRSRGRDDIPRPSEPVRGDVVVVEVGGVIPCSGSVIEGAAMVDESAITGESAPVLRESGSERCAVMAGSRVLTGRIVIQV